MDDEQHEQQHEQIMVALNELKKLSLRQDTRTLLMMEHVRRIDRTVETARICVATLSVIALGGYVLFRVVGGENFGPLIVVSGVLYLAFLAARWTWRKLRRSAKQ